MRRQDGSAFVVLCCLLFGAVLGVCGCPRPAPPHIPSVPDGMAACPRGALPVAEDVCDGLFTLSSVTGRRMPCTRCAKPLSACVVMQYGAYCVANGDCADKLCALDTGSP